MHCYQYFLRLRCSNLTFLAIVYHEGPSFDNRIPRVGEHDGHSQEF
jgi:hypothetical protein